MKILKSISAIFIGLYTVLLHLFRKPVTEEYPEEKPFLNGFFRGRHTIENCAGCGVCQRNCPTDAITIQRDDDMFKFFIDYSKCIFCGNCVYYCPKKSMQMTSFFELATPYKKELCVELVNKRR